jgi:hypothetical protein
VRSFCTALKPPASPTAGGGWAGMRPPAGPALHGHVGGGLHGGQTRAGSAYPRYALGVSATEGESRISPTLRPDDTPGRPRAMDWTSYVDAVLSDWHSLLLSDPEEQGVQRFLERHPAMIPGGSGDVGQGGHHGSGFPLGRRFRRWILAPWPNLIAGLENVAVRLRIGPRPGRGTRRDNVCARVRQAVILGEVDPSSGAVKSS